MVPELGIAHGSGIRDSPVTPNWGLPMAPEFGIANPFWTFIVFVTNGVAMRDLDMLLPGNVISR